MLDTPQRNEQYVKERIEDMKQWSIQSEEQYEREADNIRRQVFVNTYLTNQAYGGPEEGGWWYMYGEPEESVQFDYAVEAHEAYEEISNKWKQKNIDEGNRETSSVSCDGYYQTWIEDKFAVAFPKQPQTYE